MTAKTIATIGLVLFSITTLTSCGNTIRGMGRDTANVVDATQDAGRSVERSAN
jgi:predicted small secreted protein